MRRVVDEPLRVKRSQPSHEVRVGIVAIRVALQPLHTPEAARRQKTTSWIIQSLALLRTGSVLFPRAERGEAGRDQEQGHLRKSRGGAAEGVVG